MAKGIGIKKERKLLVQLTFTMAGAIRIELTLRGSESRVLPLHQAPPMRSL